MKEHRYMSFKVTNVTNLEFNIKRNDRNKVRIHRAVYSDEFNCSEVLNGNLEQYGIMNIKRRCFNSEKDLIDFVLAQDNELEYLGSY